MNKLKPFIETVSSDQEQVNVLGLILYTDAHAHVKKVLRDADCWKALDVRSGRKWTILSARASQGAYSQSKPPLGTMGRIVEVWNDPSENEALLEMFHLENTEELPVFVLFCPLPNGRVLQSKIGLSDESEQAAFVRMRYVIDQVAEAVKRIDMENRQDFESVFRAMETALFDIKVLDGLASGFRFIDWVKSKLPSG